MAMGYIDREEAMRAIDEYKGYFLDKESTNTLLTKIEAKCIISDVDDADVAPVVHGKWEYIPESRNTYSHLRCTNCGWWTLDPSVDCDYHYCPRCGAKMDKED